MPPRRSSAGAATAGALAIDSPEPEFEFDDHGDVRGGARAGCRPSPTG